MEKRKRISKQKRKEIWEDMDMKCGYCGYDIELKDMQADHIVPIKNGGKDERNNLISSCRSCNHRKGSSSIEVFRKELQRSTDILERDNVTYRNALRYNQIIKNKHNITFYFEGGKK